MIQIHDEIILSMEFKSIIKAHDSNTWQNNFINRIQIQKQNPCQKNLVLTDNIKSPIYVDIMLSKVQDY